MSTGDDLPDGWQQPESDAQAGQYNPQQPIRYERDDIEVHLQPATNTADTGQDVWRLNVISDDREAAGPVRDGIEGRGSAIDDAREFMETYNERCVAGEASTGEVIDSFR
jgi:glucose dehydrogenase